ncbi:hypothetical protein I3843_01G265000 [Carya illinoinensis]|nr:hypothetical protein I3760_01G270300 [Carya illinoinensis]KAG7998584.1 hypothetical protein I3843_01G265000 [Carya illinoinensis]
MQVTHIQSCLLFASSCSSKRIPTNAINSCLPFDMRKRRQGKIYLLPSSGRYMVPVAVWSCVRRARMRTPIINFLYSSPISLRPGLNRKIHGNEAEHAASLDAREELKI